MKDSSDYNDDQSTSSNKIRRAKDIEHGPASDEDAKVLRLLRNPSNRDRASNGQTHSLATLHKRMSNLERRYALKRKSNVGLSSKATRKNATA